MTIYIDKTSIEGDRNTILGEGNIIYSKEYKGVIINSYSMIDKWGRGRGMYDIIDVLRGSGDAVKRIAAGVGGYYPHSPPPNNMFHVEHFSIILYI